MGLLPTAILVLGLLGNPKCTIAQQTTNVTCLPKYNWMDNSRGQNPCLVAAYLQGTCNGGDFSVNSIPPDSEYVGPTVKLANPCQCSTITYSMISACSLCQNNTNEIWSTWSFNCSTIYTNCSFPYDIPTGTAVPKWAYLNVLPSDYFNITLAQAAGDSPESTATRVQSTGGIPPSSSAPATSTFHTTGTPSAPAQSTSSGSSSSHAGPIAGGVVGGVVALAAIGAALAFYFVRRRRSHVAPSAAFSENRGGSSMYTPTLYIPQTPLPQPKLYDPSDPSTFPVAPPSPTILSADTSYQNAPSPTRSYAQYRPGHYSGVPEI
ncbi:hypothetical protein BV22DRAFT_1002169 [Leucogyrophana mollusca]|uniref:Uncharacterized protein n=1 Tax=Leucogyrophana mollusca TaxID=85980 RepID=A0ACB8BUV3_9AGAM|nr:hypothetical protein BV22DRAFT_1002169 [Leucogyrophana mollusca]